MFRLGKDMLTRGGSQTTIFASAILSVSLRWTDRLIGFVSTLILARLLAPDDFGIIAMASLVVGLSDVLLGLGVNVALIQTRDPTQAHYDTAWTLRLAQLAFAATLVCLAAPQAEAYFNDARIAPVLYAMAAAMLLTGLENIGVITFQKEMRFQLDFRFVFLKRIVGFVVTIIAAWILRSYWALVIGTLAGRSFGVLLSYRMHPMRPRISFEKMKEIFSVSQWVLLNNIGNYLNRNLHKILVGRRTTAGVVGGYTLADEISSMPSTEVLAPLNRVLFPAFVAAKHDPAELKRLFLLAQGVQSLLGISAGVGLALVANEAVHVLLGEKWLFIAPFIQVLALANVVEAITTSSGYVFMTLAKVRLSAMINWVQAFLFVAGAFLLFPEADAIQIGWLRVLTVVLGLVLSVWILLQTLENICLADIFRTVSRPLLGTGAMALAVTCAGDMLQLAPLAALIVKISIGLVVFPVAVLLLWWMAGRPSGAEAYLLNKLVSRLRPTA